MFLHKFLLSKNGTKNHILKGVIIMSNTVKAKGNIYNLAKLAKERMKQNNYTKVKGNVINNATTFADYISKQKVITTNKKVVNQTRTSYDDELYKKVCNLIETKNTVNPISMLIDKELFSSLDTEAKQFYINNLTQKYKYMRNRYFREHPVSLFV